MLSLLPLQYYVIMIMLLLSSTVCGCIYNENRGMHLNNIQKIKYLHGKMLANRFFILLKGSFDTSWEAMGSDPRD